MNELEQAGGALSADNLSTEPQPSPATPSQVADPAAAVPAAPAPSMRHPGKKPYVRPETKIGIKRTAGRPKKINPKTGEEYANTVKRREQNREAAQKVRDTKKAELEVIKQAKIALGDIAWDSPVLVEKEDIAPYLRQTGGMSNEHVISVVADLAERAARLAKVPLNHYVLLHGAARYKECSIDVPQPMLEAAPQTKAYGEVITERDLQMLYVHNMEWREVEGRKLSWEEFKDMRVKGKIDAYFLGKEIFSKDWHDVHRKWADEFFIKRNPDLLPLEYTQEDLKNAVAAQDPEVQRRLLLASRNAYKSTFQVIDLVGTALTFIEAPILLVSSIHSLSKGFIRSFRNYFICKNWDDPTLFNALYPEMCIAPAVKGKKKAGTTDSLRFRSPMSRLDLIQPTAQSTSLDAHVAGERAMFLACDDVIDNFTSSTEEVREGTLQKFDLLVELLDPCGYIQMVGTPYMNGDLYQTIIDRASKPGAKPWHIRFDPAWTVKPSARQKGVLELEPDDVDLLFPERLTFADLMASAQENMLNFLRQKLVQFTDEDSAKLRLNFDLEMLQRHVVQDAREIPDGETHIFCDRAFSTSRYSDLSSVCVGRIGTHPTTFEECLYVLEVRADRWRSSELCEVIAQLARKYASHGGLNSIQFERNGSGDKDLFDELLKKTMGKYMVACPVFWRTSKGLKDDKWRRFKSLEGVLYSGRLWFAAEDQLNPWLERTFAQIVNLDGRGPNSRSSSKFKDDIVDSISLALPYLRSASTNPEDSSLVEQQQQQALRAEMYSRVFGTSNVEFIPSKPEPEPDRVRRGAFNIPGIGGQFGAPASASAKKVMSFGDVMKRNPRN